MIDINTHENFVNYETAKLLKEAGFNWPVRRSFYGNVLTPIVTSEPFDSNCGKDRFGRDNGGQYTSAPTTEIAQKWVRDVKGYNILVCHDFKDNKHGWWILKDNDLLYSGDKTQLFETYEDALEAGIQKYLILISEHGII